MCKQIGMGARFLENFTHSFFATAHKLETGGGGEWDLKKFLFPSDLQGWAKFNKKSKSPCKMSCVVYPNTKLI